MAEAISNTSPLLYLFRISVLNWLPRLLGEIWIPEVVVEELKEGQRRDYDVPTPANYDFVKILSPRNVPSDWLTLDLGAGELETTV